MKKRLALIVIISVAAILLLPASSQANMLKNPGFEEGQYDNDQSLPGYWQGARSDGSSWYAWKSDGKNKYIAVGGKSEAEWGYYKQNVSGITPGQSYFFSASVATEVWGGPTAYLKVEFKDGKGSVIRTDKLAVLSGANGTWDLKKLTTNPAPPEATNADFICYGQGVGTVTFDDISVEKQSKDK